jgi:hypothetical protein
MKINPDRIYKYSAKKIGKHFAGISGKWIKNPIFIVGCGRSGTTLITDILGKHKDIADFSEANDLWDPNGYPWRYSDLKRPPEWLDPITFNRLWWEDISRGYFRVIKGTFGAFQKISRKKYFLNKSPMNTFKISYITEIFPDASFIHVYRDGRAVVYSYMQKERQKMIQMPKPYKKKGFYYEEDELLEILGKFWVAHITEIERQNKIFILKRKTSILEICYENFCEHPQIELNKIFKFVKVNEKRIDLSELPDIQNRNYKFQQNLSKGQINKITSIMKDTLVTKGYDLNANYGLNPAINSK